MSEIVNTQIGSLPRDWGIQSLGISTLKIQDGTHFSPKTTDGPCRYVTSKNIRPGRLDLSECGWISQAEHDAIYARCDVKHGDLLLTKDGANTGNACLNDQHEPFSLLSSVAFLRTDGKNHDAGFILQYLLSPTGQRRLKDLMSGNAIPRLTLAKIKGFKAPVPSPYEQHRIAEILSTVDDAIEQTEALIAKQQQIKAGLMHDLFTRGVTPDGRLRPARAKAPEFYHQTSLGWIPKEWTAAFLSDYLDGSDGIKPGPFGSSLTKDIFTASGFRVYGQEQVIGGSLELGDYFISPSKFAEMRAFEVREGDVLLSLVGTVGCVLIVKSPFMPGIINPRLMRLRPRAGHALPEFIRQLLLSSGLRRQIDSLSGGGTMPVINGKVIRRLRVPAIGRDEQERIVARLGSIDENINSSSELAAKLRQQKQGLMQDLLTGRVPVPVPELA